MHQLRRRTIALVGLMGVGKSSVGRRLASALDLPFRDADAEVEAAAGRSISDIFADLGEAAFREGERRVIARLLDQEPHVLATGGSYLHDARRHRDADQAPRPTSVWLKADLDVLARRISRKDNRPLLTGRDPLEVLQAQADARDPAHAEADVVLVETGDAAHHMTVEQVIQALTDHLEAPSSEASAS